MKISNKIKKITGSLIILSIIIMPFSDVKKVNAQVNVNYGITGSDYGSGNSTSLSGYVSGMGAMITQLPGCKAVLGKNIRNLFTSLSGGDPAIAATAKSLDPGGSLYAKAEKALAKARGTSSADPVQQVNDTEAVKVLNKIATYNLSIQKSTSAVDTNENCMNAIGKAVVKILIQKMTLGIVNWIQTGDSGKPLFLTNPGKYFADIGKNEILGFGLEINNPSKYPFGKAFMQNVANGFNNKFADNAQYSLDKMIQNTNPQYSAITFNADFSQGGWNAWDAMVQNQANNPLGFQLMASNELQMRLAGTVKSNAEIASDTLLQGGGFLGDERCTDPWGVTREENEVALKEMQGYNTDIRTPYNPDTGALARLCKKWEYVTPGAVIANKLTTVVNYNDNALLDAETINDAMAAILDATMARFTRELTDTGLAYMDTDINNYDQFDSNQINSGISQVGTDFSNPSTWLLQNPSFNIRTDFNQALIDTQRTYIDKLISEDAALSDLIKWIRQLDYCIPGPNPDWETTASNNINNVENKEMKKEWWNSALATGLAGSAGALGMVAGPIGGAIGATVGITFSLIANKVNKDDVSKAYAGFIQGILGVNILQTQDEITDPASFNGLLNNVLSSYAEVVNDIYFNAGISRMTGIDTSIYMPTVTLEARAKFEEIGGYQQMIADDAPQIISMKSVVTRLENLKNEIDTLNSQLVSGSLNQTQYETNLIPYIDSFERLSSSLVSGDDIASVDNTLKQIIDEKDYVKNNLLEGSMGCETELEKLWNTKRTMHNKFVNRQPYPYPIDHFYGYDNNNFWNNAYPNPYGHNSTWGEVPWNQNSLTSALIPVGGYVSGWNQIRQGFLFGSVYYNDAAGPFPSGGLPNDLDSDCRNNWIHDVQLTIGSKPGSNNIGGLKISGGNAGDYKNMCGVVLNFERNFGIY